MLNHISLQLDSQAPENFSTFITERQEIPTSEMYINRAILKPYLHYFGRDSSLSISFSAHRFSEAIRYDLSSGKLIIRNLAKSLKIQLSDCHHQSDSSLIN